MVDLDKIVKEISFKYIFPDDEVNNFLSYKYKKYLFYLRSLLVNKELRHFTYISNTLIENQADEFIQFKKSMQKIEGMSTIANAWIINQIAKDLDPTENYLNIGCWKGFSLIAGMLNTKCNVFGVDNFSWKEKANIIFYENFSNHRKTDKHFFYEGDYVDYLKQWSMKNRYINFYFYDGPHTYNDQYQSLEIASEFFTKNTIILVDDTNWTEPREATMDFIAKNDKDYKILKDLKCSHAKHPTFWNGLIIFKKI
ncbi:MAG: class I SAM-dependent methyltransferase [Alphaproteobacteria bacterium]